MRCDAGAAGGRTPLTVIGGFLGAGKTTLLNRVLAGADGRYAVLVNDFGAVNVDAGLIADHDGETLRLTNGCVCCSLGDSFLETLMRVLEQSPAFDHIVIEASGVSDPSAIAEIALVEPGLRLSSIVVLADAERIASLLADERVGDTVERQVRAADILLLNKLDLVGAAELAHARAVLVSMRPDLRIVETVGADLPEALLDLAGPFHPATRFKADEVSHEGTFRRFAYRRRGRFDPDLLPAALARLPASLLRLKGRCSLVGTDGAQLVQMVGSRWSLAAAPAALVGDWPIELVGIGADADADEVSRILDHALAGPGDAPPRHETPEGHERRTTCL